VRVGIIGAAVLATVAAAPPARACECLSGIWPWPPPGSTIPTNGILILRGNETYRDVVSYIDERRPALSCGKRQVPLRLDDIYVGHGEIKARLVPARALPPSTRCELVLRASGRPGRRASEPIQWINTEPPERTLAPPWWNTAASADRHPPAWTSAPAWTGEAERGPGCGVPGSEVTLKVAVAAADAEGPLLYRVVLDDGREKNDVVMASEGGAIDLGYQMCSGVFELEQGRRYRASLSAIDAAGNETRAPVQLPPFIAP
jgi:hypothetical protein